MKKIFVITLFSVFVSCTKDVSPGQVIPAQQTCLQTKINSFSSGNYACPTGANVKEYLFQNSTVYVFDPGNCMADMTSEVINSDCQTLGYLGGFAANILINSEDFSNVTFLRTVWTN